MTALVEEGESTSYRVNAEVTSVVSGHEQDPPPPRETDRRYSLRTPMAMR